MAERSSEMFYNFEPYFKRSDGQPGWQWQFLVNAHYKGRVALGANRIGKTEMGAYECCLAITGKHPYREYPESGIGWIVGLDNPMIRDIDMPMFEKFLPSRFKHKFHKQDNIWECKGEGREWVIAFKSTEAGRLKFQGQQLAFAWIDEEPKDPTIFPEIEARLIDLSAPWWITATPLLGTAALKEISGRENVYKTFAGMRDNPYLPLQEIEDFAASLPEDDRRVRVDGEYIVWGGKPVFNRRRLRELNDAADIVPFPKRGMLIAC